MTIGPYLKRKAKAARAVAAEHRQLALDHERTATEHHAQADAEDRLAVYLDAEAWRTDGTLASVADATPADDMLAHTPGRRARCPACGDTYATPCSVPGCPRGQ